MGQGHGDSTAGAISLADQDCRSHSLTARLSSSGWPVLQCALQCDMTAEEKIGSPKPISRGARDVQDLGTGRTPQRTEVRLNKRNKRRLLMTTDGRLIRLRPIKVKNRPGSNSRELDIMMEMCVFWVDEATSIRPLSGHAHDINQRPWGLRRKKSCS